jgi:hypothetical protein
MKQFLPEELIQFLQKTDEFLTADCELIVIGGEAAALAYGVTRTTTDIDLATEPPKHFLTALDLASKETGISIPVSYVGLHEPPYAFESRLTVLKNPAFNKLHLYMPERHDLALMKMVRGYENDIQAIEEIHQTYPLELDIFIERFMDEMTQVSGNPSYIRLNFLLMVEALFSPEEAEEVKRITKKWTALLVQKEAD